MAGGGPSSTQTVSTTSPPPFAQGAYSQYLSNLQQQLFPGGTWAGGGTTGKPATYAPPANAQLPPSPQPFQQVAPFSPLQTQGQQAVGQMGAFNPVAGAAAGQEAATLGGAYLGPNPYLNQYYNQAANNLVQNYQQATSPDITAAAVSQGALGGSGQNQAQQFAKWGLGQNLANLGANIYEPAYQFERGQQAAAVGQAPQTIGAQYIAPQQMMNAGGMQQTQLQNILNTGAQNLGQQGMWPYQALQLFGQGLGSLQGGQQTIIAPNAAQGVK